MKNILYLTQSVLASIYGTRTRFGRPNFFGLTLLSIFSLLLIVPGMAQDRLLNGKVTDAENSPLIGASVLLKGAKHGTVTDFDGHFRIQVPDTLIELHVAYVGFSTKTVKVPPGKQDITIKLEAGHALDEVIVTGHGRERRKIGAASAPRRSEWKARGDASIAISSSVMATETMAAPSIAPASADASGFLEREVSVAAGQLTAGELHDFSKWELWQDIAASDLEEYQKSWKINPKHRYAVQLTGDNGKPLVNVRVRLQDGRSTLWEAKTDNTGKAELWAHLFEEGRAKNALTLAVEVDGKSHQFPGITTFHQGINMLKVPTSCNLAEQVDMAFMVDATGSMGDEIQYLQAELADVIAKVQDTLPGLSLRVGSIFYRDKGEEYVTRTSPLQSGIKHTLDFIKKQSAGGGGDYPEAVEEGLERALQELDWNPAARARLLFMVLDAPPHQDDSTIHKMAKLTRLAAAKGVRIIPVVASGINKSAEYLFRSIALATNGTYVFLTDDSGIGNPHIKPTTDEYEVEKLNDLLVRLVYQFAYAPSCEEEIRAQNIADLWPSPVKPGPATATVQWQFFPNPTAGPLTVNWQGDLPQEVFLSDMNGKLLKRFVPPGTSLEIDLSAFPAGSYLLGFEKEGKWEAKQVLRIES